MTQTYVFGGQPAQPSSVSYSALPLTANTQLAWPWVDQDTTNAAPLYLYVTPTGAFSILMPDATGAANGQAIIVFNVGPSTITMLDSTGMSIVTIAAGIAKYIILRDNSTAAGTWQSLTFGAGTNAADAGALAGLGLSALSGAMLNSNQTVSAVTSNITADANYRAQLFEVTAATGAGTLSFASVGTLGNGWWMGFSNLGTGAWTLDPNGSETIDGNSTIILNPTETCLIFSSGSALFTVGRGRSVDFIYTALNKNVAGSADVTLSSTEASNLLIKFFGTLTGNINVIVPSVVNEYMIRNATSGAFTLTVKTASGAGIVATQGEQAFIKCDGTDCFNVVTNIPVAGVYQMPDGSVSLPGLPFASEPSTGLYRPSSGIMGIAILGAQVFGFAAAANTSYVNLIVQSADAGAAVGPLLTLYRNSISPVASDIIGGANFDGRNSTPAQVTYASIQSTILDPTGASEDATLDFLTIVAGTLAKRGGWGQGFTVGAASDNGAGTITTTGAIASAAGLSGTTGTFTDVVGITKAGIGLVVTSSSAGAVGQLVSTDAGSGAGPSIDLYRNSVSPAASDFIGAISATGQNSTPAKVTYGSIVGEILDPTASSEDFAWLLNGKVAGADTALATLGPGLQLGAPTGGDKGVGTLNATGVYVNGAALSLSGATIQTVPQVSTTYQTCSTPIPDDDTPPLATEGDLVLSVSFTPKLSTSTIVISVVVPAFNSTTVNACVSLCSSANSGNAVAAVQFGSNTATFPKTVSLLHTEAASSTAARTYSIRCGPASGSVYINGNASTRKLGGVEGAIMIIQEIAP